MLSSVSSLPLLNARCLRTSRRSPSADLPHKRQKIADAPVVRDFSVLDAHDINRFEVNFAMRRSDAEERTIVGAVVGFVGCYAITIRELPMNLRMKVRKRRPHVGVELADAGLIRRSSRLGGVIYEIVRKEFFEGVE